MLLKEDTFDLAERRLVNSLISALPEQLKWRLTKAETEQFASRLISRLISDGLLNSITLDSVAQSKDVEVRGTGRIWIAVRGLRLTGVLFRKLSQSARPRCQCLLA